MAIVQGITEFIPVSSSGHLVLFPLIFGFKDQRLYIDVAVHFGSLLAILIYFKNEIQFILTDWIKSLKNRKSKKEHSGKLGWAIILATIPIVAAGFFLHKIIEDEFRSASIIAYATIGFGILLGIVDIKSSKKRNLTDIRLLDAFLIGLSQVLALIPGTSRSGITITAGLALGLTRDAASRFSFLLAIPTIFGAFFFIISKNINSEIITSWGMFVTSTALSAFFAFFSIHFFLKLIEKIGMWPFVIYRIILGLFIIIFLL